MAGTSGAGDSTVAGLLGLAGGMAVVPAAAFVGDASGVAAPPGDDAFHWGFHDASIGVATCVRIAPEGAR